MSEAAYYFTEKLEKIENSRVDLGENRLYLGSFNAKEPFVYKRKI